MRVLVTGAGGFLGGAVARMLIERGDQVVGLNRSESPAMSALGVDMRRGDIADPEAVSGAASGCDAVVHVAAKAGVWGRREAYFSANVTGTENVLEACRRHRIPRLVYTSTPSVIHAGGDVEGADESAPYPDHFEAPYPETKAIAERCVLSADGEALDGGGVLCTVALRPHLIWGPGDNHLVPRIVDRARRGRLRLVGGGKRPVDGVYIDNAARAHVLALDRLAPGAPCAGKAYFVTNGEPMPAAELINGILRAAGLAPVTRSVSPGVAYAVGALLEAVYGAFGVQAEPPMTRFVARQLATAHWYDITAARRDLGYVPEVSTAEGLRRLEAHLSALRDATG